MNIEEAFNREAQRLLKKYFPGLLKSWAFPGIFRGSVEDNMPDMVSLSLEFGAEVNHLDYFGRTALIDAARAGHEDIVRILLDHDADTNIQSGKDAGRKTALMLAAWGGRENIVRMLLDAGANREIRDANDKTAVDYARRRLHRGVPVERQDEYARVISLLKGENPVNQNNQVFVHPAYSSHIS